MNFVGGDFEEIFCSHPEHGQMRFHPKSNEAFTIDFGGVTSNDDENAITGSGIMIDQLNNRRWSMEGPIAVDMRGGAEEIYLDKIARSGDLGTWTLTHISGAVWRGQGKPVGARPYDTNAATLTLKIAGSQRLENIT